MSETVTRRVPLGAVTLSVREWGSVEQPPLVLLHGLASTGHMFDLIAPTLAERWHVIAPDQRGHGESDKPDSGYDFESVAGDLDGLLDAYGLESAAIVGHSWGAYTALYYAATRPARVVKAGLIDGGVRPLADLFATWDEAEVRMSPPTYQGRTVEDIRHMIEFDWLGAAYRPELMPLAFSVFDASDPRNVRARLSRANHLQIAHALWEMRPADYFARVRCPLLIVTAAAGQQPDADMQGYLAEASALAPAAQLVTMPDTIHDAPWQRPHELAEIIERFLAG